LQIVPLLISISYPSFPAYAGYSGGSETADDLYQIATAEDLTLPGKTPDEYSARLRRYQ